MKASIAALAAVLGLQAFAAGPGDCGLGDVPREALLRVNAARSAGHRCGSRAMPPVPAVAWDVSLYAAASSHSHDMARRHYFDHRSPEGHGVRQRALAHRYPARVMGENIATGDTTVAQAMQSWLASAEHCQNLLDPEFKDVAVACARQPGPELRTYWTMVLGSKR
ncbi:MAG: hypothetical protein JWP41_288 [Ramlibacter sp.]|jgi:uncharacterized protein YkwD|nr:hypothetical protein [Ramlibacter sp.]